jgi:hypothetical protein
MKKLFILLMSLSLALIVFSQEPAAPEAVEPPEAPEAVEPPEAPEAVAVPEEPEYADTVILGDQLEVIETPDKTRVSLGKNEVIIIEENGDTVIVGLGSKGISIVEEYGGKEAFPQEK